MLVNVNLIFIFLCWGCFVIGACAKTDNTTKEKSGPFVSVLKSIEKCKKPTVPYTKNAVAVIYIEQKNNTIQGNFTVLGKNKNIQVTIKEFYYADGKWQLSFIAKNVGCRNRMISVLIDLAGVAYDRKTCEVPKGAYAFEIDYNKFDHFWSLTREYGRKMSQFEVHTREGTTTCLQIEAEIKPAK